MGLYVLNDHDREIIIRDIEQRLKTRINNPRDYNPSGNMAPELYIAKLPDGLGLDACDKTTFAPGVADCRIYKLVEQTAETEDYEIEEILDGGSSSMAQPVYNPYFRPWFAFSTAYLVIYRDKTGSWVCEPPPTKYRAILNAGLVQGGTSTARLFYRNSANTAWEDSGEDVDVVEFTLNTDEMFVAYQKGGVEWDEGNVWVFDSTACPVADDTGLLP